MLNLTDEQKAMFYSSGYYKGYRMVFDDINLTIDNEIIHQESVTITQSICNDEELSLGGCIASSIEFEVSEVMDKDVTGLEFKCYMDVEDTEGKTVLTIPMGVYRVDSAKCVDGKDYKKIIAYDALYDASVDISEIYNSIFKDDYQLSIEDLRLEILSRLGIVYAGGSYANDDVIVGKTVDTGQGNLTGTMILKNICEANGAFGYMNRYGKFDEIKIGEIDGLYPAEYLYPAEDLYPASGGNAQYIGTDSEYAQYITTKFEEYETMPITCVTIKSSSDDIGVASDDDESNPYVISSNILFFGKSQEELKKIGKNIKNSLNVIVYRPNDTTLEGLPYMDPGDWYSLAKERESVICPVFSRTLKGIQGLMDTFSAKGSKVRANETTSRDELIQLMGKSLEIKKSIDGLSVDVTDLDKRESSHFEQTSNTIVLKVDKNGRMVEVELGTNADDGKNYFKVTADNINLTAEEVLDLISDGTINLSGKNINIESENFTVDSDGNVEARSIDIEGGTIHLSTTNGSNSLIKLSNYNVTAVSDGKELDIKYYSEGAPGDYEHPEAGGVIIFPYPQVGDLCFDVSGNRLYRFETGDGKARWYERTDEILDAPATVHWSTSRLTTGEGLYTTNYDSVRLEVDDGSGGTTSKMFQNGSTTNVDGDGIHFHKKMYTTRNGTAEQQKLEANVTLETAGYDENLKPEPELKFDSPISTKKVTVESLIFDKDADSRLDFEKDRGYSLWLRGCRLCLPTLVLWDTDEYNGEVVFKNKSIVRDFSTDPLPSTGILKLDAPQISSEYPVTVVNGDGEACPDLDFSNIKILPSEGAISVFVKTAITGMARITYSYWAK